MENGAIIDDFPSYKPPSIRDSHDSHGYVSHNQRVSIIFTSSQDLEVKTMKETTARWKPTADMAELEATTATTQVVEIDAKQMK